MGTEYYITVIRILITQLLSQPGFIPFFSLLEVLQSTWKEINFMLFS